MSSSTENTINVQGISPRTTKDTISDFFSFCGIISSLDLHPDSEGKTQEALICFEKGSAVRTALLLNGASLDEAILQITTEEGHADQAAQHDDTRTGDISQEDKPKAGIIAELLATGYILSDKIIENAIAADQKLGVSGRFLSFVKSLDQKAGETLSGEGQTISGRAQEMASGLLHRTEETKEQIGQQMDEKRQATYDFASYYQRALTSSFSDRVSRFWAGVRDAQVHIQEVREEALRIRKDKEQSSQYGGGTAELQSRINPDAADVRRGKDLSGETATEATLAVPVGKGDPAAQEKMMK